MHCKFSACDCGAGKLHALTILRREHTGGGFGLGFCAAGSRAVASASLRNLGRHIVVPNARILLSKHAQHHHRTKIRYLGTRTKHRAALKAHDGIARRQGSRMKLSRYGQPNQNKWGRSPGFFSSVPGSPRLTRVTQVGGSFLSRRDTRGISVSFLLRVMRVRLHTLASFIIYLFS